MEDPPYETIRIGPLTLRYFADSTLTSGAVDFFEFSVPPMTAGSPPHYHRDVDEMVYGIVGRVTFVVAGEHRVLGTGDFTFIPRGAIHSFSNQHGEPATVLSLMTPALIGPAYFREMAALFANGAPDAAAVRATMLKHGLIPV